MPLQKLQFRPGVNKDVTSYSNEGGWVDIDKVRFRLGFPEKIGGWAKYGSATFLGVARALHNWIALDGSNFLGIGTHLKYYIEEGTGFNDITPLRDTTAAGDVTFNANELFVCTSISGTFTVGETITGGTSSATGTVNNFIPGTGVLVALNSRSGTFVTGETITGGSSSATATTSSFSYSTTITVKDVNHGANPNDFVTFSGSASLGGNITAAVLDQEYQVTNVVDSGQFEVTASVSPSFAQADVNGAVSSSTNVTVDGNNGTIAAGMRVQGAGISGVVTVATVTSQTAIVLDTAVTLADNTALTFGDITTGGTATVGAYQINVGLNSSVGGTGWGAGTWGRGGWGSGSSLSTTTNIRIWSHDNFGEDLIINPRDSNVYYWDKGSGLASRAVELSTLTGAKSVPQIAKQVLVSDQDRHVIAFGCDSINTNPSAAKGDGVQDPLVVRFSSQENAVDWYPTDTNTAGDLILGSGSEFVQAVETKREILVWTDTSLHSMRFIGPPFTFGLQQLASNITIMGPNAAVATEDVVYWMGIDNFYTYSGQTQQLDCTVKNHVFNDFNLSQTTKVFASVNSEFSEVIWLYPSESNSLANGGTGENDRYVIYNYKDNIWYYGTISRSAWIDRGTRTYPIAAEGGYLYNHEFGYDDDGSAMTSFIESAPMDIGDGDKFSLVTKVIPDLTFTGSTSLSTPQATFTLKARTEPGTAYNSTSSGTTTRTQSSPVETFTEQLNLRVRGRTFAVRLDSNALGTKWTLGSPRVDIRPDGRR